MANYKGKQKDSIYEQPNFLHRWLSMHVADKIEDSWGFAKAIAVFSLLGAAILYDAFSLIYTTIRLLFY